MEKGPSTCPCDVKPLTASPAREVPARPSTWGTSVVGRGPGRCRRGSARRASALSRSSHASTAAHAESHASPAPAARSRRSSSTAGTRLWRMACASPRAAGTRCQARGESRSATSPFRPPPRPRRYESTRCRSPSARAAGAWSVRRSRPPPRVHRLVHGAVLSCGVGVWHHGGVEAPVGAPSGSWSAGTGRRVHRRIETIWQLCNQPNTPETMRIVSYVLPSVPSSADFRAQVFHSPISAVSPTSISTIQNIPPNHFHNSTLSQMQLPVAALLSHRGRHWRRVCPGGCRGARAGERGGVWTHGDLAGRGRAGYCRTGATLVGRRAIYRTVPRHCDAASLRLRAACPWTSRGPQSRGTVVVASSTRAARHSQKARSRPTPDRISPQRKATRTLGRQRRDSPRQ